MYKDLINCKNCGAVLEDNKCPYCGSEYKFVPELNDFYEVIRFKIQGHLIEAYVYSTQFHYDDISYRNLDGELFITRGPGILDINLKGHLID